MGYISTGLGDRFSVLLVSDGCAACTSRTKPFQPCSHEHQFLLVNGDLLKCIVFRNPGMETAFSLGNPKWKLCSRPI